MAINRIPYVLRSAEEKPISVKELFEADGDALALRTETPARMVLPLVRLKIVQAASNPNRRKSLIQIFVEEFDRRMISLDRKGRLELITVLQAALAGETSEEVEV